VFLKGHNLITAELKRLYVRPGFRGLNIGWQLVNTLMEEARKSGYQRVILDSHISMKKAHKIYEGVGFKYVKPPEDYPENLKVITVFMESDL
jgi:ribosomal protein S18 acetylase RimI-like enzyme